MACKKCIEKPVIHYPVNNVKLCKNCFLEYFEKKVFKTIRDFNLIEKNDKIGVAVSGGKDSLTVMHLINEIVKKRRDVKIVAIAIDEGINNYRDKSLEFAKKICKKEKIELKVFSYKKEVGQSLDNILKKMKVKPCSICGVLRRYLLNKKSRELGITKLATGHNMDDEAQSILMNQFRNNIDASSRMGPITGVMKHELFVRRIKPLYFISEKETTTYALLKGFLDSYNTCPYGSEAYREDMRNLLNNLEKKYPGTKYAVINSFLEILPLLKEEYRKNRKILQCENCGEPCSQKICQACRMIEKIGSNLS